MSRYNSTFKYKQATPGVQDPDTGFWGEGSISDWIEGGECHIEKHIPPKEIKGADGTVIRYVYEIFLPVSGINLSLGTSVALFNEDGTLIEEIIISAFDNTNRKHIAIWA
ncbi:MAG: hypothetical protein M1445_06115 [Bacteroidetes bacterium]|nr:hypothetical protein [Bacteroidota bacterium]